MMNNNARHTLTTTRRRFLNWFGCGIAALALSRPLWSVEDPQSAYSETIAVMTMLYHGEVESEQHYKAYEQQALKEGYINVAHLFAATADFESIHGKQFKEILTKLGLPFTHKLRHSESPGGYMQGVLLK